MIYAKIIQMIIRFWGTRGSVPVCSPSVLKYGGDTTCVELRSKNNDLIVIDAGTGIRDLAVSLKNEKCPESFTMMFTHSHTDHIWGFPFFFPVYRKGQKINISCCNASCGSGKEIVSGTMRPPIFPVKFENAAADFSFSTIPPEGTEIYGIKVTPVAISHPDGGSGFRFEENGRIFVFLTDNELKYNHKGSIGFEGYAEFCRNADLLVHDAQYNDEEYKMFRTWGHSTYSQVLELAEAAEVRHVCFFHHSPDRTDAEIDTIADSCNALLRTSGKRLSCSAVYKKQEIRL